MRLALILLVLCLHFPLFASWEFSAGRLSGSYHAWISGSSVKNQVNFNEDGSILLLEKRPQGVLRCYGKAEQEGQTLKLAMLCQNGRKFQQAIDFSEVRELERFQAPVFSSLFLRKVLMNFELLP